MNAKYDTHIDMSADNSSSTLILRRVKAGSRVLEFGPATGYMTRYLQEELGCRVSCVELDPESAALSGRYCEKMIIADLDSMDWRQELEQESFDYLIFADVLEHLKDPWGVLKFAVSLLKRDGTVLTSIPNIGHSAVLMDLFQGKFAYRSLGLLDNTHLRFFTRQSVLELLDSAGLCPVEVLTTVLTPDHTEFHQEYKDYPELLQNALQRRGDAHVYQFVSAAKRKKVLGETECGEPVSAGTGSATGYAQVYWEYQGEFREEHSAKLPLRTGADSYEVEIPAGAKGRLRLDPVNYPAYVEISRIELFSSLPQPNAGVKPLALWSADSEFARPSFGEGVLQLAGQKKFRLACTGMDPQLILSLGFSGSKQPMTLRIGMRVFNNLPEMLAQEVSGLKTEFKELENQYDNRSMELARMRTELMDREHQLERILCSPAWVFTSKLRRVLWYWRKTMLPLTIGYEQVLMPLARVRMLPEEGPGAWEAVGKDPQIILKGPWPKAWTEVSWQAASDHPLRLRLYFDRGRGFNEAESLELGVVEGENLTQYRVIVPIGTDIKGVRLDPGEGFGRFTLREFKMNGLSRPAILLRAVRLFFRKQGLSYDSLSFFVRQTGSALRHDGPQGLWQWAKNTITPNEDYGRWLTYKVLSERDKEHIRHQIDKFAYRPTFSIIVPVYNVAEEWLRKCIESVRAQLYPHWELCIADDASTDPRVKEVLDEYARADSRIKVVYREKNGHISASSNSALELATGEYAALLDNDDELTIDALYENALMINRKPDADMIYSDEDKITEEGERHSPFFKPEWCPDTFLSQMYICHLGVYRTKLVRQIGGFRMGLEGSQDYDLVLRFTELTKNIYHIPKILYHWRTIAQSTAMNPASKQYAYRAGEKAIQEALDRRGEKGWVKLQPDYPGQYVVHYPPEGSPLISILIPTRDKSELLQACLNSIFEKTTYANFEILIIDNGSVEEKTLNLFEAWQKREPARFRVLRLDIPFNYSVLNNQAVKAAKGELILLLNNDMEVITPEWLEEMAGQALRPSIGAVGAKLLYPDDTLQHAGVILGIRGVAGHGHKYANAAEQGYFGRLLVVSNYSAVTGACLMVKKQLFEAVGGLDETLQVAFNDVDFCLKLQRMGLYHVVLPHVQLYHHESKSRGQEDTPEKMQRFLSEVEFMEKRWGSILANDPCYSPNLSLDKEDFSIAVPPRN